MSGKDPRIIDQPYLGGNPEFWKDDVVKNYDYQQSIVTEGKEEALLGVVRVACHFVASLHHAMQPILLDVGCGPGTLSTRILDALPDSIVIGVDASHQMADAANRNLASKYGPRFHCFVSGFNTPHFWLPDIDKEYDAIVSSGALHYLSDERRIDFFRECHGHLKETGVFVSKIATCSDCADVAEMQKLFRIEYAYQRVSNIRDAGPFAEFKASFEDVDRKANVNWKSHRAYLGDLLRAGFSHADVVRQHWVTSTFVAVK